jgi:hypothetical protein
MYFERFHAVLVLFVFHLSASANCDGKKGSTLQTEDLREIVKKSEWCYFQGDSELFVTKTKVLVPYLIGLDKQLNLVEKKEYVKKFGYKQPDVNLHFFAIDGRQSREIGALGFWHRDVDRMYIQMGHTEGYYLLPKIHGKKFLKEIKPTLYDFELAIHGLEAQDLRLVQYSMESLAQDCFRDKAKRAVLGMESFLSHQDEFTRHWAARMILKTDPFHKKAQEYRNQERKAKDVQEKKKEERGSDKESREEAIQVIFGLGGRVVTDPKDKAVVVGVDFNGCNIVNDDLKKIFGALSTMKWLDLRKTKVDDDGMKHLQLIPNLQELHLSYNVITDAGIKRLSNLKKLRVLSLRNTEITNEGLKQVGSLRDLEYLDLGCAKVTGAGLRELTRLEKLTYLGLERCQQTDLGLKHVSGLKGLEKLDLSYAELTVIGVKELCEMKNLKVLYVSHTSFSDACMSKLSGLTKLQFLHVGNTAVTDEGLKVLDCLSDLRFLYLANTRTGDSSSKIICQLKQLRELDLTGTKITEASLVELSALKNLEKLWLGRTSVTESGLLKLRKALPKTQVTGP